MTAKKLHKNTVNIFKAREINRYIYMVSAPEKNVS
jgi:hypothetical protein